MTYGTYFVHTVDMEGIERTLSVDAGSHKSAKRKIEKQYPKLFVRGSEKYRIKKTRMKRP